MLALDPSPALRPHVHRAVSFAQRTTETVGETELPFAGAVLIVALGDPLWIDGERVRSFAAGVHDRPVVTRRTGDQRLLQLDLTPLGARRLLGVPMEELTNRVVDLDALLGAEIVERADAEGWKAVDAALTRRLQAAPAPRAELVHVHDRIVRSHGGVRIEQLARETGWSRRHLATTFRREAGVTPKTLARIARFERAHRLLRAGRDLADVAFECGFSDQPHLSREVRDLAHTTPAALA